MQQQTTNNAQTTLRNDTCAYRHKLSESVAGGNYILDPVYARHEARCYASSPFVRLQRYGVAECDEQELIDIDSELRLGQNRKLSRCPTSQITERDTRLCSLTLPHRGGGECDILEAHHSRLTEPPCTLRGTSTSQDRNKGILLPCTEKLQKNFEVPFATNVHNRILVKDNHRPCVPHR